MVIDKLLVSLCLDRFNIIGFSIIKVHSGEDTQEFIKTLRAMADEKLNITITFINYIPRTKMGKFPFIITRTNFLAKD